MNERHIRRRRFGVIALLICLALGACGQFEIGVEQTPTPDLSTAATVTALIGENALLATQVAQLAHTPATTVQAGNVAYVQSGDIWVRGLPSGQAQRLTTDGRNREPRWSPSGEWLAFRKGDFQVWLMRADGNAARPLNGGGGVDAFAWSPVADLLAFVASGAELQLMDVAASRQTTLASRSLISRSLSEIGRIAWRPDGQTLAYELRDPDALQPSVYQGLWEVGLTGQSQRERFRGEATLAEWTSDGAQVLFWRGSVLSSATVLPDGAPLASLGGDDAVTELGAPTLTYNDFVAAEPGGQRLALVAGGGRGTWTTKRLHLRLPDGGDVPLSPEGQAAVSPAWSPDGTRIAYSASPDTGLDPLAEGEASAAALRQRRIYVAEVKVEPGSQPRQLTADDSYRDERPEFSRDGAFLLFARIDSEGRGSLWFMPQGGGEPRQVVDTLSPAPGQFGYFGHVDWEQLYDWWRGAPE